MSADNSDAALTFGRFLSFDGTQLAYQLCGPRDPDPDHLPIVLTNGLGGDYRAWKYVLDRFGPKPGAKGHTLVTWDYRGLYRSEPPRTPGTLGPAFQALDLKALLDHLGWNKVLLVGWSMGVQVNFEAWRRFPERVAGICVINGVAGSPFHTALGTRLSRYVIPSVVKQMRRWSRVVGKVSSLATSWSGLLPIMVRLGFVGATIDMQMFAEFARTFASLDFNLYGATLQALGRHDAYDVLPTITVPVRIITGDRDMMTPLATARRLEEEIPHARLRVLTGATHYTPVEFPAEVCQEIEAVLRDATPATSGVGARGAQR